MVATVFLCWIWLLLASHMPLDRWMVHAGPMGSNSGLSPRAAAATPFSKTRNTSTRQALQARINNKQVPIFEFGRTLSEIIASQSSSNDGVGGNEGDSSYSSSADVTEPEPELMYQSYVNLLRDHYFDQYVKLSKGVTDHSTAASHKSFILKECEAAMRSAIPACKLEAGAGTPLLERQRMGNATGLGMTEDDILDPSYSYADPLRELIDDIDRFNEELLQSAADFGLIQYGDRGGGSIFTNGFRRHPVLTKRLRWVAAQLTLLAVNFIQTEWVRSRLESVLKYNYAAASVATNIVFVPKRT